MLTMQAMRRFAPNAVTALGHVLTVLWLLGGPWPLALVGLACDALDGFIARRLGATTEAGSVYDWLVDTTTAALVCARLDLLPLVLVLAPAQVWMRVRGRHVSGRAALVIFCVVLGLVRS